MKSFSKKSVHARKLTFLTTFALIFAVTGCSNADDESPDLEETTDASVSDPMTYIPASEDGPAENVPEPRLPGAAADLSEEGALETLDYFWRAEEYARLSGNTRSLEVISNDSCDFCVESIKGWSASYDEGVWAVLHDDLEIETTDVLLEHVETDTEFTAYVFFELHEPATSFFDQDGERQDESFDTPNASEWFALLNYDGTSQMWKIDWVGLEESLDRVK